ncbi:MAG: helix-turn-helix transcriptional regulator [Gordonia amarae]
MYYPGTTIADPGAMRDAYRPLGVHFKVSNHVGVEVLVRPLRKYTISRRDKEPLTGVVADVCILGGEPELAPGSLIGARPFVTTLVDVLELPGAFTVAGVVTESRHQMMSPFYRLNPLPEASVARAAAQAAELGWDTPADIDAIVGSNIAATRTERVMSQSQLAQLCELSQSGISDIESGKRPLDMTRLYRIAVALGVPPTALMP